MFAASAGVVTTIKTYSSNTTTLNIDHGGGIETRYLHMPIDQMTVTVGSSVASGQRIGNSGAEGAPGRPHLHFETWAGGNDTDPVPFMAARGVNLANDRPLPAPDPDVPPIPPIALWEDDMALALIYTTNNPVWWVYDGMKKRALAPGEPQVLVDLGILRADVLAAGPKWLSPAAVAAIPNA